MVSGRGPQRSNSSIGHGGGGYNYFKIPVMLTIERLPCDSPRPRSFAGLMELYEHNYLRLRCLCPDLDWVGEGACSRVHGALDLHAQVLENRRYTSTIRLTYLFDDAGTGMLALPDLRLRLYHDARQVEVLSRRCRFAEQHWLVLPDNHSSALLCKWRLNRFLYKWLNFCLHQGHRFTVDAPLATPVV